MPKSLRSDNSGAGKLNSRRNEPPSGRPRYQCSHLCRPQTFRPSSSWLSPRLPGTLPAADASDWQQTDAVMNWVDGDERAGIEMNS
jgi:hypothetical protein